MNERKNVTFFSLIFATFTAFYQTIHLTENCCAVTLRYFMGSVKGVDKGL